MIENDRKVKKGIERIRKDDIKETLNIKFCLPDIVS